MQGDVMEQLRRHLARAEHVDVSQYQFINLEAVKAAAGERWTGLRERVFLASRSILEKRLAESDLIIECASGFLVVLISTSGKAAVELTRRISADMESFFLGDRLTQLIRLESSSERLSIAEFTATFEATRASPVPAAPPEPAQRAEETRPGIVVDDIRYYPAWDPSGEAVAAFMAQPRARKPDGSGWLLGPDILHGDVRAETRLALDLAVLSRVNEALQIMLRQQGRCAVIVPVSYATLSHGPTRTRYVTTLAALPATVRRLIFIKLTDAPVDAPAAHINEACRTILPHCGRLLVHLPLHALTLDRFDGVGASSIGASLPAVPTRGLEQDMAHFAALARRIRCTAYFDGVTDWELLRASIRGHAKLLCGPAFGQFATPQPSYRLTRAHALRHAA